MFITRFITLGVVCIIIHQSDKLIASVTYMWKQLYLFRSFISSNKTLQLEKLKVAYIFLYINFVTHCYVLTMIDLLAKVMSTLFPQLLILTITYPKIHTSISKVPHLTINPNHTPRSIRSCQKEKPSFALYITRRTNENVKKIMTYICVYIHVYVYMAYREST